MRRGSTHVRCQVKRVHGVTFGEFVSRYIVSCVVIHFPRNRKQGAECFDVFRCCTIGKLQGFKWHFFSVHGYPNGRYVEMLKIVRILFQSTVKRFALDQSEDICFRHQSIEKVIFSQGGISCGNDETLAFDAADRIDGGSFFQRDFMGHGNAWIDFHFTYLEIGIGEFHPVIGTVFGGHQTELVAASMQNNFQIYVTQHIGPVISTVPLVLLKTYLALSPALPLPPATVGSAISIFPAVSL